MRSTIFLLLVTAALAQPPRLEFEAATVKPAAPIGSYVPRGGPGTADPTHVNYRSLSMKNFLMAAYDLPIGRIMGPAWIDSERYDVTASLAPGTTKEQLAIMLQNLVADRFGMAVHRETRDMALFEISVEKSGKLGPGLTPHVEGGPAIGMKGMPPPAPGALLVNMGPGRREVFARKQPMSNLVTLLAAEFGRPVIDKTGLAGDYDYVLEYVPEGTGPAPAASDVPSLQSAVRDQLGLRLEAARGPLEVLVVDRGNQTPTEN